MNELIVTGRKLILSKSTVARNPDLYRGRVDGAERKRDPRPALDRDVSKKQQLQARLVVRVIVISLRQRLQDDQNSACGGNKALQDAICESLEINDADPRIKFEYSQHQTAGRPCTIVMLQLA